MLSHMTDEEGEPTALIFQGVLSLGGRLRAERPDGAASRLAISVLSSLERLGPMSTSELALAERLRPQSLTRIVAALADRGWIARTRNDRDRRERLLALTRQGRAVLAKNMHTRRQWLEKAMAQTLDTNEWHALFVAAALMLKITAYCRAARPSNAGNRRAGGLSPLVFGEGGVVDSIPMKWRTPMDVGGGGWFRSPWL